MSDDTESTEPSKGDGMPCARKFCSAWVGPDDEFCPRHTPADDTETQRVEALAVLAAHKWDGAWGDNDDPVTGKYFRCTCGWTHRVDGMNGWHSWVARHDQHVAEHLTAARAAGDDGRIGGGGPHSIDLDAPSNSETDRVARLLMKAWEAAERRPIGVSYVATFADMARAVIEDRAVGDDLAVERERVAQAIEADFSEDYRAVEWGKRAARIARSTPTGESSTAAAATDRPSQPQHPEHHEGGDPDHDQDQQDLCGSKVSHRSNVAGDQVTGASNE